MPHSFTEDWFGANRWQFEKHIGHYSAGPRKFLEIGSFEGRATCWLLDRFPSAQITCVDAFVQPSFWGNIGASNGAGRVDMKIGRSRDVLPFLERDAFDFIYVDGSHNTVDVLEDAVHSFRLAKIGSVIGFDDYKWNHPLNRRDGTPKPAIEAFLSIYKFKVSVMSRNYQVWVTKTED